MMIQLPKDGIVMRSIMITLLAFLLASAGSIAYTAHDTGKRAAQQIDGRINQLLETVQSTTKIACFIRDKDLAKEVASGLLVNSEILHVTITAEGEILADVGRKGASASDVKATQNILARNISSPFDSRKMVGEVRLVRNPAAIEAIKDEHILLAAKQLLWQLLFVSIVILSALIFFLVRPISRMTLALNKMDPIAGDRLIVPLGHDNTEIGQLVRNVNQLSEHLVSAVDEAREARSAAEAASSAKGAFLANMSHEIRTPLNAVLGFARIGMRENRGRETSETCGKILVSGKHLLGVINDILDFSKIEAGKMIIQHHPLQLSALLAETIDLMADRAKEKGLVLRCQSAAGLPDWVMGDAMRIGQILVNLLGNAIKFTQQGHVELIAKREADELLITVSDEGIGMEEEEKSRLFRPFEQADGSVTRKFGGTGLGLAISLNLATLMGGRIHVESTPGQGSVFTLYLPLQETSAPAYVDADSGNLKDDIHKLAQALKGYRILAAEDVDVNRYILEDLLREAGANSTFAENGRIALERVESNPGAFDIVLMDVQMPEMDGLEATRRVKVIAPDLPVLGLTAHAVNEEREKCFAAGMIAHVTKPIDPGELIAAIRRWARPGAGPEVADEVSADSEPVAQLTPPHPGGSAIDWAVLDARFKGKRNFIEKIFRTVLSSHGDSPLKLRQLAATGDYPSLAFLAHSIKGMAGNLAASALQEHAGALELAAKEETPQGLQLAGELADEFAELLGELERNVAAS